MNRFRLFASLLLVLVAHSSAIAHKPSDSYLRIYGDREFLTAEWDISLQDLEFLLGLDVDQDGNITWGELKARREAIVAHALSRLKIKVDDDDCNLQVSDLKVTHHSDGCYAVLELITDSPGHAESLCIEYNLLFDVDPTHRGLVLYSNGTSTSTHVLSPTEPSLAWKAGESSLSNTFATYVREGVWHIWIGFDHILFLLALLLPSVFVLQERSWQPREEFKLALRSVAQVVTVFTVAHSITLWLAVMEYVSIPGQLIEVIIAFSIVATALNNIYPFLHVASWVIAFGFGLIHGFGFANVLIDLGLSSVALGVSLFGFNVGVELGQLAIVIVALPLAYSLRKTKFYELGVFRLGSLAVAMMGAIWMVERIFNVELLGI